MVSSGIHILRDTIGLGYHLHVIYPYPVKTKVRKLWRDFYFNKVIDMRLRAARATAVTPGRSRGHALPPPRWGHVGHAEGPHRNNTLDQGKLPKGKGGAPLTFIKFFSTPH